MSASSSSARQLLILLLFLLVLTLMEMESKCFLPSARLATLGPTLDLFEPFNQMFYASRMQGLSFPLVRPRFSHISYPSSIGSASDDEPMRKLSLFPVVESRVPIRARARTGEARTS